VIILAELYFAMERDLVWLADHASHPLVRGWYRFLALGRRIISETQEQTAHTVLRVLGVIGIPVAIGVHGGTGAIFAVAKARPNWFSGLFPIIFLVSALASGGGLLTFLCAAFSGGPKDEKRAVVQALARLTVGIVLIDAMLLASEILVTEYGEIVHEEISWKLVLNGPYWWVFWYVQLGCGLVIPTLLVLLPTRGSTFWMGVAGASVALGVLGTRLNIVIPPLIQPAFSTMPEAYRHVRFAWGYSPSLNEWGVGLGVIAMGALAFLLARKMLPLEALKRMDFGNVPGGGHNEQRAVTP